MIPTTVGPTVFATRTAGVFRAEDIFAAAASASARSSLRSLKIDFDSVFLAATSTALSSTVASASVSAPPIGLPAISVSQPVSVIDEIISAAKIAAVFFFIPYHSFAPILILDAKKIKHYRPPSAVGAN